VIKSSCVTNHISSEETFVQNWWSWLPENILARFFKVPNLTGGTEENSRTIPLRLANVSLQAGTFWIQIHLNFYDFPYISKESLKLFQEVKALPHSNPSSFMSLLAINKDSLSLDLAHMSTTERSVKLKKKKKHLVTLQMYSLWNLKGAYNGIPLNLLIFKVCPYSLTPMVPFQLFLFYISCIFLLQLMFKSFTFQSKLNWNFTVLAATCLYLKLDCTSSFIIAEDTTKGGLQCEMQSTCSLLQHIFHSSCFLPIGSLQTAVHPWLNLYQLPHSNYHYAHMHMHTQTLTEP